MLNRVANFQHSLSTTSTKLKSIVGVVQLSSSENLEANYIEIERTVENCVERGAKLICLPDRFAYQAGARGAEWSENINDGKWFNKYRQLALEN
jgi:predicted amidohydrolase